MIVLSVFSSVLFGQSVAADSLDKYMGDILTSDSVSNGRYFNLEEAFKNKDNVYYLDLRGYGLKDFPMVILEFKNLTVLRLDSKIEIIDTVSNAKLYKTLEYIDGTYSYDAERFNFIDHIPCEVCSLKNLKLLELVGLPLSKREIRLLRKCCPNALIYAGNVP